MWVRGGGGRVPPGESNQGEASLTLCCGCGVRGAVCAHVIVTPMFHDATVCGFRCLPYAAVPTL